MGLLQKLIINCQKPASDIWGRLMLAGMNFGHNQISLWCIKNCIQLNGNEDILDIGCGGGKNISNLLKRTSGKVCGIDFAEQSVIKSKKTNSKAILQGRAEIQEASVFSIPYEDENFDVATALETIYFWPNIIEDFKEVHRVLKPGGKFVVCNEMSNREENIWTSVLDMNILTADELTEKMIQAGFSRHEVYQKKKTICVVAYK